MKQIKVLKDVSEEEWVGELLYKISMHVRSWLPRHPVHRDEQKETERTEKEVAKKPSLNEFLMYTENNFNIPEEIKYNA